MMMTRENMMDEVIRTRGFEDKMTIWFCGLYEDATMTDSMLYNAMVIALSYVEPEEEDEEQNPSPFFYCGQTESAGRARSLCAVFSLYQIAQHLSREKLHKFYSLANPEICALLPYCNLRADVLYYNQVKEVPTTNLKKIKKKA